MAWLGAMAMHALGADRPFWVLFVTAFLIWFLLEGAYRWFVIRTVSFSDLPLFPKYFPNTTGDEWPINSETFLLRDWIKDTRFQKQVSCKAVILNPLYLRTTWYLSEDRKTRLWITFYPNQFRGIHTGYSFASETPDGQRVVTDNQNLPYGGFYPENWFMLRMPTVTSVEKLYQIHQRRLMKSGGEFIALERDPLEEIEEHTRFMEQVNYERGFLLSREHHEDRGRFSLEGRYRIWKEIWLLRYFGTTLRHR